MNDPPGEDVKTVRAEAESCAFQTPTRDLQAENPDKIGCGQLEFT
jgi:hypothetical protein